MTMLLWSIVLFIPIGILVSVIWIVFDYVRFRLFLWSVDKELADIERILKRVIERGDKS